MKLKFDILLARAWYSAHRELGLWPDWKEYARLRKAYGAEGRYYHTWQHIYECVKFVQLHYGFQPLVILALFYHDVVYDVNSKTNEIDSAAEWDKYARSRDLHRHQFLKLKAVSDMILMTAHHKPEANAPLMFLMMNDADMHVFLCPDHHYLEYARNIWREYSSFGREGYLAGRLAFLASVDHKTIFYTHQARDLMHHAKANLELERVILEEDPDRILMAA